MSAVRPILRPARWEEDEPSRPPSPRPPPPVQAQPSATYHSAPQLHPQPPPQSYYRSSPRSDQRRIHYLEDPPQEWPVKRKKYFGVPAVYYPPDLNPSELLWRDRYTSLYQRGYQLRPRYQPTWTPTRLGNGRHHHSGEDHIMQIVCQSVFFAESFLIEMLLIATSGSGCHSASGRSCCLSQDDPGTQEGAADGHYRVSDVKADVRRFAESRRAGV